MKRNSVWMLAVCVSLVWCAAVCTGCAENGDEDNMVIEDGVLVKWRDAKGNVTIPSGVTKIGYYAFLNCYELTGVTIPDGVTEIDSRAFEGCLSLESIEIPASVTEVGVNAFSYNQSRLNISRVEYKGTAADWCHITWGGAYANPLADSSAILYISGKAVTKDELLEAATEIKSYAFYGCRDLKNAAISKDVTTIGDYAFFNCTGLKDVEVPDGVTSIGNSAFSKCTNLEHVKIPTSVTEIGIYAFSSCTKLADAEILGGAVGESAFSGCSSLATVTIGSGVTQFEKDVFRNCPVKDVYVLDIAAYCGITFVDRETSNPGGKFHNGKDDDEGIDTLEIPDSVTEIKDYAFYKNSGFSRVIMGKNIKRIGKYPFKVSHIKYTGSLSDWCGTTFDSGWSVWKSSAFVLEIDGVTGNELLIPGEVKTVNDHAFYGIKQINGYDIKTITIEEGVESIGTWAFDFTQSVTAVTLPKSVTRIGSSAFYATSFTFSGTKAEWNLIIKPSNSSISSSYKWTVTCTDGTITGGSSY